LRKINRAPILGDNKTKRNGAIRTSADDKKESLFDLVQNCEMLKMMLFYAKKTKAFPNFNSFQHATGLAVLLCKQSDG